MIFFSLSALLTGDNIRQIQFVHQPQKNAPDICGTAPLVCDKNLCNLCATSATHCNPLRKLESNRVIVSTTVPLDNVTHEKVGINDKKVISYNENCGSWLFSCPLEKAYNQ